MTPLLTRDQVRRVDDLAVRRYGIPSLILMENAGRSAAQLIDATYGPSARAVVFCGPGNNGGDGCVIARHLHNKGWFIRLVMTAAPDRYTPDTATNFSIVEAMGLPYVPAPDAHSLDRAVGTIASTDVVVDALLGTGFQGNVREPVLALIRGLNAAPKRAMVAVDVPSGLDCDAGSPGGEAIRADLTITFVAAKPGLIQPHAAAFVGRLEVADIGAPRELIKEIASVG